MRRVHKSIAGLLCAALVLTCLSLPGGGFSASADETDSDTESSEVLTYEYEGHTFSYETEDDAVTITGCTDDDAETTVTELTLPDTIDDVSVTAIGDEAFYGYTALTTITLPDTLTEIGSSAFYGCTSLAFIELPDALTEIGSSAFRECSALTSVDLPDGITDIARSTFRDCTSLAEADLPENLKTIQMYAFYDCQSLEEVCFPDTVTTVYEYAYYNCTDITYILLPASDISIRDNNFTQSTKVETLEYAEGCTRPYTNDSWQNGMNFISVCKKLILPSTITSLATGNNTYEGEVESDYFCYFTSLEEIEISEDNPYYATYENCIYDKDLTTLYIFPRCASEITFSPTCTTIAQGAFANCGNLTELVIPETVTTIQGGNMDTNHNDRYGAITTCSSLETIIIPDTVTELGDSIISACGSLTYVSLYLDGVYYCFSGENSDYVKVITDLTIEDGSSEAAEITDAVFDLFGTDAIGQNSNSNDTTEIITMLETLHLPASTTSIDTGMLEDMTSLTSIEVNSENTIYYTENGVLYQGNEADGYTLVRYPTALGAVDFAKNMTAIGERAFYNCSAVSTFEFPDTLTEVGAQAFYKMQNVDVTFAEGLETIGDEAFYYSMNSSVYLPESVSSIGTDAFYTLDASLTLTVAAGSYAEEYAIENELTYVTYEITEDTEDSGDTEESGESSSDEGGTTGDGSADGGSDSDMGDDSSGTGSTDDSSSTDTGSADDSSSSNDSGSTDGTGSADSSSTGSTGSSTNSNTSTGAAVGTKVTVGNAVYKVTSATAVTYVKSTKNTSKVTIPATVKINGKSYKVTSVSASAFAKNTKLKTVVIGKNVKTIGKKAFYNCKNLKKITFKGKNVKSIGAKAFKGTAKKAAVKVPKAKKAAYKKLLKKAGLSAKATIK